jgi:membrane dipeptidase
MNVYKRRTFIKNVSKLIGLGVLTPSALMAIISNESKEQKISQSLKNHYSSRCISLIDKAIVIDMLSTFGDNFNKSNDKTLAVLWETVPASFRAKDYEFIKSCGVNIFGWGNLLTSDTDMLKFLASQNGIIASNPDYFERIDTKEKLLKMSQNNKIGMLMTNQDSKHFNTLDDVELFYRLGQRVSQITYNDKNRLGCGAFEDVDSGLTDYGKQVIKRMNKVGMGVDVSHCGDKTTIESINESTKPALITHGACRSLAKNVARAKTDEAIKLMASTGGVIGIPILRFMISEKEPVSIDDFTNHIDYVAQLVGINHVGIGSDQGLYTEDYLPTAVRKERLEKAPKKYQTHTNSDYLLTIDKLNHPHRVYDIAESLINKGYKDDDIKKVLGGNFQRALIDIFKH